MANIRVRDAGGLEKYIKSHGAGTDLDPFVYEIDVSLQDQTTPQFSLFLGEHIDEAVVFRSAVSENDETVEVTTAGPVPTVGNFICIKEGSAFTQMEIDSVTPVAGNDYDLGVSIHMDHAYTTGAQISLQNVDMNVNGGTPVEFVVSPAGASAGTMWDITRMIISMTHDAAGDDGLFGDIETLPIGTYFRIEDGTNYNLFNAKENADFASQGYDITYPTRSGKEGVYGTRSRITFNGPDKRGVVFRLVADTHDKFLACVRDNLTSLGSFRVMVQGQVVDPT